MVCYIYRWRVKPGHEDAFVEAWTTMTVALRELGSLGARLHRAADGHWYSYAQWPSAEARSAAFSRRVESEASAVMAAAIAEHFDEVLLEVVDDRLAAV